MIFVRKTVEQQEWIIKNKDFYKNYNQLTDEFNKKFGTNIKMSSIYNFLRCKGLIKKFYLNNLLGNSFAVVNTDDYRKNLITGFSERIVDVINTYSAIGTGASDIRVVIDSLVDALNK